MRTKTNCRKLRIVFYITFLMLLSQTAYAQVVWDGGGATNNWSEAANWSTDTVPLNTDVVIFDGTSTKDVTFDIPLTRTFATTINAGYTGTLSAGSTNLTFAAFTQNGGIFNGGSGTLDFNSNFTLSGGTFTQSSNLNLFSSFNFTIDSPAVFNHNNGTFVIDGPFNFIGTATSLELFNLRVGATHNFGSRTMIVNETLELNSGNAVDGIIEARNNLIIATNYTATANVRIAGNNTRTITLPITANMPRLIINAQNVTVQPSSTSGTFTFATTRTFNVGTINGYAPVTVNATAGTFGASTTFTVGGNNGTMAGSSPSQSLTRNWTLEPSAGGITSADIRFDYLQTDVPVGANEASFSFLRNNGTTVTPFTPTSIDTTANFATLNGVTAFSAWTLGNLAPLASTSTISGRVVTDSGRGISKARLTLTDSNGNSRIVLTNPFGYYRFDEVESGENYVVSVFHKRYEFPNPSQVVFVSENLTNIDFTAINQASSNSKLEISGYVKNAKGLGMANISIEISGGSIKKKLTVKTDSEGFYSFDDLTFGETYFLNVKSNNHSFSNPSRVITLSEDLTDADFVSDSK